MTAQTLSPRRRAAVLLADGLTLFLGLYGSLFCLITAFQLPADRPALTLGCLLAAGAYLLVCSLPKLLYRLPLYLLALALAALYVWQNWALLKTGALVCARQVAGFFAWSLGSGSALDITPWVGSLTFQEETGAVTALCAAFLWVFGLWLGWLHVRLRSFWLTFWGSFLLLLLPLSVTITPEWGPLVLLLLFYGVGLLTRLSAKRDPYGAARTALCALPLTLGLLAGLSLLLPQNTYQQSDWAGRLRLQLTDWLTITSRSLVNADGDLGLAGGGSGDIDLSQAGPLDFTGRTALRVESETTGRIYLRGLSAATYTGDGWEQLPGETYDEMRDGWTVKAPGDIMSAISSVSPGDTINYFGIGDWQPINFPALADAASGGSGASKKYVVENVGAPSAFVYTPYQLETTPERMTGAAFVGDSYLARGVGVWKFVLYARDGADPESGAVLTGEAAAAENRYRNFVQAHYLQVPENLRESLSALADEAGLTQLTVIPSYSSVYGGAAVHLSPDLRMETARRVADYLAGLAEYDPDTPLTPQGEDFALCFLTDTHRGYCMHFASAATLLLRTVGVPARYVSGYVADVKAGETVEVPDYNAHAWVEVYCDGYGWQPVEVTPGFDGDFPWTMDGEDTPAANLSPSQSAAPSPSRPAQEEPRPSHEPGSGGAQPGREAAVSPWWLLPPALLAALIAGLVLRRRLARRARERRFAGPDANQAIIAAYLYLERLLPRCPGAAMDPRADALAKKAKFSQHAATEEERAYLLSQARALSQRADAAQPWYQKLFLRFILALT